MAGLFSYVILILPLICFGSEDEKDLLTNVTSNYNKLVRPVTDNSKVVKVNLELILLKIMDMHELKGTMTASVWSKLTWHDYQLKWDPQEFGKIPDIRLPIDDIWQPDICLYNSADGNVDPTFHLEAVISNDGSVLWVSPAMMAVNCKMHLYNFPYDTQVCYFQFGSWTYSRLQINLISAQSTIDISEYQENSEWVLKETKVVRSEKFYDCCPAPYVDLKFHVTLQRRSSYYTWAIIVPVLLLTILSIIGFLLPPARAEKLIFEGILLISFFILYGILIQIPLFGGNSIPFLLSYCFVMMLILMVTTRAIFVNFLGHILCLSNPPRSGYKDMPLLQFEEKTTSKDPILEALQKVHKDIQNIGKQLDQTNDDDISRKEWDYAAAAIDRLCFILLISVLIVCIFVIPGMIFVM